jgi:TusE/DsrC/DsvC family sulfur relay protein
MKEVRYAEKKFTVDEKGFLADPTQWDEDVARALAEREGIADFSKVDMDIVRFMRKYYEKFHAFPILNYVCKNIHQPRECVDKKFVNPMRAWKIAGLPEPSTITFETLDGEHYHLEECC